MLRTLLLTSLLTLGALPAFAATVTSVPTVVEVYTSKNCPSCPAAERYLEGWLEDTEKKPLVIYEHVDYWDEHALKPDPRSLAEATQRQYDYSNTLGRRPGEVFTPQPIINGRTMVKPSLRFNWPGAISGELVQPLEQLKVAATDHDITITLPTGAGVTTHTLWMLDLEKDGQIYHLKRLSEFPLQEGKISYTLSMEMPKPYTKLLILQKEGPGPITHSALVTQ